MPLRVGKKLIEGTMRTGKRAMHGSYKASISYGAPAAVVGGAAAGAGAISAMADPTGPYPGVQKNLFGHEDAIGATLKAGVTGAFANRYDVFGPTDYYYGRPHRSPSRQRAQRVPGDIVFGAYNTRR